MSDWEPSDECVEAAAKAIAQTYGSQLWKPWCVQARAALMAVVPFVTEAIDEASSVARQNGVHEAEYMAATYPRP